VNKLKGYGRARFREDLEASLLSLGRHGSSAIGEEDVLLLLGFEALWEVRVCALACDFKLQSMVEVIGRGLFTNVIHGQRGPLHAPLMNLRLFSPSMLLSFKKL
jgi:hypothetical protein